MRVGVLMPPGSSHPGQKSKTCSFPLPAPSLMVVRVQLHQLEYLVAVADEGGFTAAAQRLHVAQPGVSAQVRKLERELGHALFDRSGHRVRPTAVGEEVLRPAR